MTEARKISDPLLQANIMPSEKGAKMRATSPAGSLPFSEAVIEVALQQQEQANEAEKTRHIQTQIKLQLSELEKQNEAVMLEFWATEKHIGKLGDEIEHRRKHSENLEAQTQALYMENVNLQLSIEQEEEHFQLLLAGYNTYRNKMDAHREVIAYVEGKTATTRELLEKREIVKKLREKKEELRTDLENPEGNVVRQVQGDIYNLKIKISEVKETVNKKIACLVKEQEVHIQLKKEVEMQNRRCEAILKRLHCQLNKTQSNKRQWNWDIQQMERKVAELRKCLGITE